MRQTASRPPSHCPLPQPHFRQGRPLLRWPNGQRKHTLQVGVEPRTSSRPHRGQKPISFSSMQRQFPFRRHYIKSAADAPRDADSFRKISQSAKWQTGSFTGSSEAQCSLRGRRRMSLGVWIGPFKGERSALLGLHGIDAAARPAHSTLELVQFHLFADFAFFAAETLLTIGIGNTSTS